MFTSPLRFALSCAALAAAFGAEARAFQDTTRLSVDSAGGEADLGSFFAASSADGQVVVFTSGATNLVAGDTNQREDVFVHDRRSGTTERVSVDSAGNEADNTCLGAGLQPISRDGTLVVFESFATNLDPNDTNGKYDVYLRDRVAGTTTLLSVDPTGAVGNGQSTMASISGDGRFVCFTSGAKNLVANDTNQCADIFVRDLATGITERVSVDSNGNEANRKSFRPVITRDGRYVAFESDAYNLVANDKNNYSDVFLRDRQSGTTERVSLSQYGKEGHGISEIPSISDDGNVVVFISNAQGLVPGDYDPYFDVFVRDRALGTTTRVSVDSAGNGGDGDSLDASIDAEGRRVAFTSRATDLVPGDTNGIDDVFVHDLVTGATERVSVDSAGVEGNDWSEVGEISPDGREVVFCSQASNLIASDTNNAVDVFVRSTCGTDAAWTNYGSGFPGTHGVPSFTSQQFPSFGTTITVDLANSYGAPTVGLLALGLQRGDFKTKLGGDLLVVPALILPITFSYGGDSFTGTIPDDVDLCGATIDLQGIETDPGAAHGLSFSQGLELTIGN